MTTAIIHDPEVQARLANLRETFARFDARLDDMVTKLRADLKQPFSIHPEVEARGMTQSPTTGEK